MTGFFVQKPEEEGVRIPGIIKPGTPPPAPLYTGLDLFQAVFALFVVALFVTAAAVGVWSKRDKGRACFATWVRHSRN